MKYLPAAIVVASFLGALYWSWRTSKSRQSDNDAIEMYVAAKGLRVDEVRASGNHWRYWLRGHLLLSNVARIYVINGTAFDGKRMEIHVAVDPVSGDALKILQKKVIAD